MKLVAVASLLSIVLFSGGSVSAQGSATELILWDADRENDLGLVLREYPMIPKKDFSEVLRCPRVDAEISAWIQCERNPSPFSIVPDLFVVVERSCSLEFALSDSSSNRYREHAAQEVARGFYALFIRGRPGAGGVVDVRMSVNGGYAGGARIEFLNPVGPSRVQFDE